MEFENVFESNQEELEKIDEDDEIYEMIEAPKYVDLTRVDHFLPDDRNWFCLRIGCDQNHEDVDPDALHKSFVLRVMAARSPNLRLRKALRSREVPSAYKRCPLSAPAKPSKPRICKFTALASVSHKMAAVVKVKPLPASKISSTPSAKLKVPPAVAKALTTPRVKSCIPSSDHFRSVQNPKRSDAVPESKMVAKALVFNTPKKAERSKSSSASETPLTDICDGMKKLELNSQRKKPSLNSRTASELSTLKQHPQKLKRQVKNYGDCKDMGAKSLKHTKSTRKLVKKSICPPPQSTCNADREVDGESKSSSYGVCSVSGTSRSNEGSRSEQQSDFETRRGIAVTTQEEWLQTKDTSSIGTPLTEICNGLKKLEINSQRKKPSWNSSKFSALSGSRPKRSRTISDPSTTQKMKSMCKDSENSKDQGAKSLKSTKSSRTNTSKKLSCLQLHDMANGDRTVSGTSSNNKEKIDVVMTTPRVIHEEYLPSLEASSNGENVQIQLTDASSDYPSGRFLSIVEKVWEEEFYCHLQVSNEEEHIEVNNMNEHGGSLKLNVLEDLDDSVGHTSVSKEEYASSSDKNLTRENDQIGENVQSAAVPRNNNGCCLSISQKDPEKGVHLEVQTLNEIGDIHGRKGDDENRLALVLKSSDEHKELSVLETLNNDLNNDDKENAASFDDNRISNHDEEAQRNLLHHGTHENQQKVVLDAHGKASKGNSALATTGPVLGKYKKTKPTNPKPFRLRTDERVIHREANMEKRHLSAPLQEITLVSRNSDGSIRRQTKEQKTRPAYHKTLKSVVEPNTTTTLTLTQKKLGKGMEREAQKRDLRTTKPPVLQQQQHMKTPRRNGTRKTTTISLVASRRLSIIKEKSSATILRPKDTKYRNKRTLPASISYAGISLAREKKPATVPKEPKFHTPRRFSKPASEAIHAPKSCKRTSVEVIP